MAPAEKRSASRSSIRDWNKDRICTAASTTKSSSSTARPNRSPPIDDYGHGTHVAGLISGSGEASQGDAEEVARDGHPHRIKVRVYRGIAPKARIISLKVLSAMAQV